MMRRQKWILIVVGVAVLVGGVQRFLLRGLEKEKASLLAKKEMKGAIGNSNEQEGRGLAQNPVGISSEGVSQFHGDLVQFFLGMEDGELSEAEMRERWMGFFQQARSFSAANISELVSLLEADGRIPREVWDDEIIGDVFVEMVPFEMMSFLKKNPELKGREFFLPQAFYQCLQMDLSKALKLFEEGVATGNPDFQTTRIRSMVLLSMARDYPDKMLSMAQTKDFQGDPDALMHLGGFVDDQLENSGEFIGFLEAVRRAEEKGGNVEFLAKVRGDFIRETQGKFRDWSFEETKQFVSGGLDREEQFEFFQYLKNQGDLSEPEKWADWFVQVESEEWAEWSGSDEHPLVSLLENTARRNQDFGESYLKKMPSGELRDEAMLAFAWRLADSRPEKAAVYLEQLPKSQSRNRLKKRIEEHGH